jgi:nicotinamide-nucleotide amidase
MHSFKFITGNCREDIKMKCEIIAVGTELLLGNIVNSNARYLSERLAELGIDVYYHVAVGDNLARLKAAIEQGLQRSDMVITTGGLGPTDDDMTKEGAAAALGVALVPHRESLDKLEAYFAKVNRPMAPCNLKQGYIPEGAVVLENNNGTAPGILLEQSNKAVILLPGPPKEMMPMFEEKVFPYLKSKSEHVIKSLTLRVTGVGESSIQEILQDIFAHQSNPTVAPYAKDGEVHLRITAKCKEEQEADRLLQEMKERIEGILGKDIYGYNEESLEYIVYQQLQKQKLTIAFAESCTGGMLSGRLTNVPGVSEVFYDAIVTYSNEAKMKFLDVKVETLKAHGAVSPETAKEMAAGIKRVSGTDMGVSVTGIAGPEGGSAEKPVGFFYIGLAYKDKVEAYRYFFPAGRDKVRWYASTRALDLVRRELLKG